MGGAKPWYWAGLSTRGRGLWLTDDGRFRLVEVSEDAGPLGAVAETALRHPLFGLHMGVTALGGMTPTELRRALLERFAASVTAGEVGLTGLLSVGPSMHARVVAALKGKGEWDASVSDVVAWLVATRFKVAVRQVDASGRSEVVAGGSSSPELVLFREAVAGGERFLASEPVGVVRPVPVTGTVSATRGMKRSRDDTAEADDDVEAMSVDDAAETAKRIRYEDFVAVFGGDSPMSEAPGRQQFVAASGRAGAGGTRAGRNRAGGHRGCATTDGARRPDRRGAGTVRRRARPVAAVRRPGAGLPVVDE